MDSERAIHARDLQKQVFRQFKHGAWRDLDDVVAPEEILRLHWGADHVRELLAFPDGLDNWTSLALGHALIELCGPSELPVLTRRQGVDFFAEPVPASRQQEPDEGFGQLTAEELLQRMGEFIQAAGRWEHTGCFHRMALYDPEQQAFVAQVEDIGRHNCLDRLAGLCLQRSLQPKRLALFASARATGSLVDKAVRAGFALMVSRSAVTTAGIERAEKAGMSLLGFAREIRFTVFTDTQQRVHDPYAPQQDSQDSQHEPGGQT